MCKARREHYLELVSTGMNFTQAARMVGVSKRTGKVWRNGRTRASGRNEKPSLDWYRGDMEMPKEIHQRFLNTQDRIHIADWLRQGKTIRHIARLLDRSPSTISREIKRNINTKTRSYEPYHASQLSAQRLKRPKTPKILANPKLLQTIKHYLAKHWSPEQISHQLRVDFPDNETMNACAETIYQAIYVQAKGQLKLDLKKALRTGRVKRRPHKQDQQRHPRFRDPMIMISDRPATIEDRAIPGHWEGDLILGANNQSAIGTLVERSTRFTILLYLPNSHTSEEVQNAIIKKMQHLPKLLRNSLTWDQGTELALHKKSPPH